jgi:hypothetical protein
MGRVYQLRLVNLAIPGNKEMVLELALQHVIAL